MYILSLSAMLFENTSILKNSRSWYNKVSEKLKFRSVIIMNNIEFLEMIRWNLD